MKTIYFLILSLFLTLSCSTHRPKNLAQFSPNEDKYWNEIAIESIEGRTSVLNVIEDNNPSLFNQIIQDAKDPYLPMFWGQSLNFDSGAKKKIVEDKIVSDLQSLFNIKTNNLITHAGIMHTYAYLFSTINTPYGYKRKRWISPTLNEAFSFTENSLSPNAVEGGLLSNLTYFAGSIAFKNKTELNLLKNVSKEVLNFDYSKLKIERLEEMLKEYTLVTSLVPFPMKKSSEENDYLLIYSVYHNFSSKEFLITAFPVNLASYKSIVATEGLGVGKKISLKYNAHVEGLTSTPMIGTRKLVK